MRYNWDLKNLYSKREDFYFDMTLVRDKLKKLHEHREIKVDGFGLYNLMKECFFIREINSKTLLYAFLNYYLDINNRDMIQMKEYAEDLDQFVFNETSFIDELISILEDDKLKSFYEECSELEIYRFYIENIRRSSKYLINNSNIERYNKIISSSLVKYNNLIKNMDFGIVDGVKLNNSNIGNFLVNEERSIRRNTFNSLNNSYLSFEKDYFDIFSSIISSRRNLALEKGFSNVLESELFKDDIDSKYVDNLISGVNNNIDLMNRYLKIKERYLGIDSLHFYDINLPLSISNKEFDVDSSIELLKKAFLIFGDRYVDIINYLIDNKCLELECNDKKHPSITFSWNMYSFTNYRNRYIDIKNLAHEMGHLVNSYLSNGNNIFIYSDSTVFCGEVASLVNEIILNDYLYNNCKDKEEKIFYLTKIIENFISQVYRQIMYTEFENMIYECGKLDIDIVCDNYLSLIKKYYGNVVDVDDKIKCEWMRIGHLFRYSYYVYKYASGYILAFNIVNNIKDNNNKYIDFLSSGSSMSNVDLLKKLDIDIYDMKLLDNSFELLKKYIDELEDLIK